MFVLTEGEAAAIRAAYQQRGEFAAAIELRRLFPAITDNAQARECARTIAKNCWLTAWPDRAAADLPGQGQDVAPDYDNSPGDDGASKLSNVR
jgi:hypothetical protein